MCSPYIEKYMMEELYSSLIMHCVLQVSGAFFRGSDPRTLYSDDNRGNNCI